jgi:hypothetical protein
VSALRHRTARFLLVVAVLWLGWEAYLMMSGARRLDPALARDLEGGGLVNVAVTLGFAPEDFHIRIFQTHGIVSGVKGTTVLLNRVPAREVRTIARYYWVRTVERGLGSSSCGAPCERSAP